MTATSSTSPTTYPPDPNLIPDLNQDLSAKATASNNLPTKLQNTKILRDSIQGLDQDRWMTRPASS